MGRPGRSSGGGSHRSSSSSRSHRSSSRSHSGSRSSFSSSPSRPSGGFSGGYGGGYGRGPQPPRPPRPPRAPRHTSYYYGGSSRRSRSTSGGGCMSSIVSMLAVLIILLVIASMFRGMANGSGIQFSSNKIDEDIVLEQAEQYFGKLNDESAVLLYYAYSESSDSDNAQMYFGNNIPVEMFDDADFWEIYDSYYYGDATEGEWLGGSFKDMIPHVNGKLDNPGGFIEGCIEDDLNWLSNTDRNACLNELEKFYNATGIQPYIVLADYEELPGVVISKGNNNTVLKTLIIAVAVIVVIVLLIGWWKKVQARKKEEQEATERMLNTPLEKFGNTGDTALNDLIDKYDD